MCHVKIFYSEDDVRAPTMLSVSFYDDVNDESWSSNIAALHTSCSCKEWPVGADGYFTGRPDEPHESSDTHQAFEPSIFFKYTDHNKCLVSLTSM